MPQQRNEVPRRSFRRYKYRSACTFRSYNLLFLVRSLHEARSSAYNRLFRQYLCCCMDFGRLLIGSDGLAVVHGSINCRCSGLCTTAFHGAAAQRTWDDGCYAAITLRNGVLLRRHSMRQFRYAAVCCIVPRQLRYCATSAASQPLQRQQLVSHRTLPDRWNIFAADGPSFATRQLRYRSIDVFVKSTSRLDPVLNVK
jgi:hypothetical protein